MVNLHTKNLEELGSLLEAVNQMNSFFPKLAQICFPFTPLLKVDTKWTWKGEHDKTFAETHGSIRKTTKVTLFRWKWELWIACDASRAERGAEKLQQKKYHKKRTPIVFASRCLAKLPRSYSGRDIQLLAVVWGAEHFRIYNYNAKIIEIFDLKALSSVISAVAPAYLKKLTRKLERIRRLCGHEICLHFKVE